MPWLTPDTIPATTKTKTLEIPDDEEWLAAVKGALLELTRSENWEQFGTLTPEEVSQRFWQMYEEFRAS